MSLQEEMNKVSAERVVCRPVVPSTENAEQETGPISNREYWVLREVDMGKVAIATAIKDADDYVMSPIGGFIPIGMTNTTSGRLMDDILPIPVSGNILGYSQIPVMVDEKPPAVHNETQEYDFGRKPTHADLHDSVMGQPKEEEQVLAINAAEFVADLLREDTGEETVQIGLDLYSNLSFIRRGWGETDPRYIQLLPYIIFYKKIGGVFYLFVYQRGKGVGEVRLAMACSVGVGGHINPLDFLSKQFAMELFKHADGENMIPRDTGRLLVESFWGGILNNVTREISEEIIIRDANGIEMNIESIIANHVGVTESEDPLAVQKWLYSKTCFFLDYKATDVEKHHLAMMIAIELPEEVTVNTREESLHDVGFMTLDDLMDGKTPTPLEFWTKAVVESLWDTTAFIKGAVDGGYGGAAGASSNFVKKQMLEQGHHAISPELLSFIAPEDRWRYGTIASIFDPDYRFYAMNAFLHA